LTRAAIHTLRESLDDGARLLVKLVVAQKPGDLLSRVFPRRKALPALDIRHQSVEVRF